MSTPSIVESIPVGQESRLSFGFLLPTRVATARDDSGLEPLLALGARAEELGFDSVWVADSPLVYGLPDPLMVLAALAARTGRVALATGMLLGALREPVLLAHSLATLDRFARGRLIVGLGAGFAAPESRRQFAAVGVPFESRTARLVETIAAMRSLWSTPGVPTSYTGYHVAFEGVALSPSPHTAGGPPIWLAGAGEAAERRVGRLADGWLPYSPTVAAWARGWERVRAGSTEVGRSMPPTPGLYVTVALDPSIGTAHERLRQTIERWYRYPFEVVASLQAMYAGTAEGFADWLAPYLRAGVRQVVLRVADGDPRRGLETVGLTLPSLSAAEASR